MYKTIRFSQCRLILVSIQLVLTKSSRLCQKYVVSLIHTCATEDQADTFVQGLSTYSLKQHIDQKSKTPLTPLSSSSVFSNRQLPPLLLTILIIFHGGKILRHERRTDTLDHPCLAIDTTLVTIVECWIGFRQFSSKTNWMSGWRVQQSSGPVPWLSLLADVPVEPLE